MSGLFKSDKSTAGSIRYLAPEVIDESNTDSDPLLDVWSLGCILFELLTGEFLFKGDRKTVRSKILEGKYYIPDTISGTARLLIQSMVEVNPNERITILECLNHPWIKDASQEPLLHKNINLQGNSNNTFNNDDNSTECVLLTHIDEDVVITNNSKLKKSHCIKLKKSPLVKIYPKRKKETSELPSLITKIPKDFNENSMYDYHYSLMKSFGGNIPNFLQPIGHNKEQKQKNFKIKSFMKKYYDFMQEDKENANPTLKKSTKSMNSFKYVFKNELNTRILNKAAVNTNSTENCTNSNSQNSEIRRRNSQIEKDPKYIFVKLTQNKSKIFKKANTHCIEIKNKNPELISVTNKLTIKNEMLPVLKNVNPLKSKSPLNLNHDNSRKGLDILEGKLKMTNYYLATSILKK